MFLSWGFGCSTGLMLTLGADDLPDVCAHAWRPAVARYCVLCES